MINFNFTLDPQDAENFLGILQDNITNTMAKLIGDEYSNAEKEWFNSHLTYLKSLNNQIISSAKKV